MIKIKKIISILCIALGITSSIVANPIKLSDLPYKSASVLPFFYYNETVWVILSREGFGQSKGTYDDFGGSRDKGEKHPVVSAARELHEEAILKKTVGLSLRKTIELLNNHTEYIISYSDQQGACNVTYITDFDKYKEKFFNNFYTAREKARNRHNKEKDRIFVVKWETLKDTIAQTGTRSTQGITISGLEQDPDSFEFIPATVILRPFLVKKLRPFFLDEPYCKGFNSRLRHYNQ